MKVSEGCGEEENAKERKKNTHTTAPPHHTDDASLHIVMECCDGGGVLERARAGRLDERGVARVSRAVLRFLAQAHAKRVVFRDVKPDNFLFLTDSDASPVRATDFGLATRLPAPRAGSDDDAALASRTGTPVYMAPEVVRQCYGPKADVWSAGVLVYQLLTGRLPFWESVSGAREGGKEGGARFCFVFVFAPVASSHPPSNPLPPSSPHTRPSGATLQDVWAAILNDPVDLTSPDLPPGAVALLSRLLVRDPAKRASAAEALAHPWLADAGATIFSSVESSDDDDATPPTTCSSARAPLAGDVVQRLQRFATHGRLKRAVLTLIADDVAADAGRATATVDAATALFDRLDADRSGGVCLTELVAGLADAGYTLAPCEVEKIMSRLDVDGDGAVDRGELLAALLDWRQLQADAAWAGWVQRAFDR